MINLAYIANPNSIHDCKWINIFAKKYNTIVICSSFESDNSHLDNEIPIYRILPQRFPFRNIILKRKVIKELNKTLVENNIDIIHSMYAFPNAFWASLINFPNHIITTRGSDMLVDYPNLFIKSSIKNRIINKYLIFQYKKSFTNSKFITSTSEKQQDIIKGFVQDIRKLKLIRTGINVEEFDKIDNTQVKYNRNDVVLFSPRSMKPIYNIDIILEAFSSYLKINENSTLVLINDFPNSNYSKQIIQKIESLNIKKSCVVLLKQSPKQMALNYKNCDIVISIPTTDGTPNTVLEAMLLKKPVIIGDFELDQQLFSNTFNIKLLESNAIVDKIIEILKLNKIDFDKINLKNYNIVKEKVSLNESIFLVDSLYKQINNETKK